MSSDEFVTWLKGFFEISQNDEINTEQTKIIKDKLFSIGKNPKKEQTPKKDDDLAILNDLFSQNAREASKKYREREYRRTFNDIPAPTCQINPS